MNEKPLERLNYYNGQSLDAPAFKTEQDYHIRTRRWLNKSLYSAGIARGLEVRAITEGPKKDAPFVAVGPGLALDSEGREIILLEEATVEVCSYAGTEGSEGTVVGNYLVIEYAEEAIAFERGGCAVRAAATSASKSTARWGGPARIEAKPKFSWVPFVPQPGSNQIVLARVELKDGCKTVGQIDVGARRYIGAATAAKVRQYALEGERHIDANNPGRIYFNIRGQQPSSVSLCLRSEKFSTLYYTELGRHTHANSAGGFSITVPQHSHDLPVVPGQAARGSTGPAGGHTPTYSDIRARVGGILTDIPLVDETWGFPALVTFDPLQREASLKIWAGMSITFDAVQDHSHAIPSATESHPAETVPLSGGSSSGNAGVADAVARDDAKTPPEVALTYVDDLHVLIGSDIDNLVDRTADIRLQLQSIRPTQEDWSKLGGGPTQPDHALVKKGTGLVRLDFLPNVSFTEGEYVIQLQVTSGGGRIHYNLYVE